MLERLCNARALLASEADLRLPMRDVAACAGISVYHFSRVFRAVFGRSPNQYRLEARLRFARTALGLSSSSITEIAFDAGFASPSTFSRVFAGRVGSSPAAYRKRLRAAGRTTREVEGALHPGCLTLMARLPQSSRI
jgi:AraC-like DNA-binding protein